MGTGEADGEKRALRAAEAAISNPLIDDVSMRGAKGLLVSITGGNDLTLYEVDEAATRIREEVDSEANIIVGATFDESLNGIIRVSVVATGVDQVGMTATKPSAAEQRLAEAARAVRAEAQKRQEHGAAAPAPAAQPAVAAQAAAPLSRPAAIDAQATAAVAAALMPKVSDDLTIRPIQPKPSLFIEPIVQEVPIEPAVPQNFIPPPAERPAAVRTPRMPRIDELPMPAQNQLRAREQQAQHPHEDPMEKPRMSLLQRLASVGLGRKEEEEAPRPVQRQMPAAPAMPRPAAPRPAAHQEPVSEYAKRPAPQGLDPHGRQAPMQPQVDDDQLDIPAFLRRQAN
jgi:cell division protein FtsZ